MFYEFVLVRVTCLQEAIQKHACLYIALWERWSGQVLCFLDPCYNYKRHALL